ncbi:DUF3048 domain-containing protein [Paenibacillus sp. GCM10027626]|uniref:DUF3048 domain-containing protein n=1 Tax=Paenibacillus sp. GCM10027626 TaxID=3273411 RepID=UPI00363F8737
MIVTSWKLRRITISFGVLLIAAALLAGCGSKEAGGNELSPPPVSETDDVDETVLPEEPEETGFIAPLTGLRQEKEADQRPIAVMVNNMDKARPQSGLPHADMVWELLAEGGITRLVAIFQSDPFNDPIGPVRSIRPYLIELGETYNAILTHAGASQDAYAILQREKKADLDEIINAGPYFWRDKSRKAPHNLYTTQEKLREGAAKKKYEASVPVPKFIFAEEGAIPGIGESSPAANVAIKFQLKNYKVSYEYNAETKLYARFINDKPHTDLTTEQQLATTNIVVLGTKHETLDDVGRLKVDLTSGGPAMLIQLGQAINCNWERSADGVIRIVRDGKELPFIPGKTYYHVVPLKPSFAEHITLQ